MRLPAGQSRAERIDRVARELTNRETLVRPMAASFLHEPIVFSGFARGATEVSSTSPSLEFTSHGLQ